MSKDDALIYVSGEVKSMWVFAAIEKAVLGTSHWGSLFDLDDMMAEEYAGDLKVGRFFLIKASDSGTCQIDELPIVIIETMLFLSL